MGWFAFAAILGALLWALWHINGPYTKEEAARVICWAIVALITGLVVWAALFQQSLRPSLIADAIGHGRIARFLLGLAVGYVAAYALYGGLVSGLNLLALALALAILALAAPHLDRWLPHMTGLKTAVIELQFASNTNYKVAVAEKIETFAEEAALGFITEYEKRIESDIDFVELIEMSEAAKIRDVSKRAKDFWRHQDFLNQARPLKVVFQDLISRLAKCYSEAIKNGASAHRLQEILRPLSLDIQRVFYNREKGAKGHADAAHRSFWEGLIASASAVDKAQVTLGEQCADITLDYQKKHPDFGSREAYPRIYEVPDENGKQDDYGRLPYLYTGAATFLMTVGETERALKLLERAADEMRARSGKLRVAEHVDYGFLIRLAQTRLYQGRSAADIVALYEQMRETAVDRRRRLLGHCDRVGGCDAPKKVVMEAMRKRHRAAEIFAMNEFVYSVSEDLARGISSAEPLEVKAKAYALLLKEAIDKDELREVGLHAIYYDTLDTYAYARLVLEARSSSPDIGVFRQMRRIFEDVVAEFEKRANSSPSRENYRALGAARLHLQSARELAGG